MSQFISPLAFVGAGVTLGDGCCVHPFAYLGRHPCRTFAVARKPARFDWLRIGGGTHIGPHCTLYYGVEIGEDCLLGDGVSIREQVTIGDRCLFGRNVSVNYEVTIGNDVRIMDGTHITGRMSIGDRTFIGVNVTTSNDRHIDPRCYRYDPDKVKGPTIGSDVMIGSGANILAGVTIGDGAVIGAHAFVTKDVPAGGKVYGGVHGRRASSFVIE